MPRKWPVTFGKGPLEKGRAFDTTGIVPGRSEHTSVPRWRSTSSQMIEVMPDTWGRGAESTVRIGDGTRDARSLSKELREIGEPCARKPARTVRRGEVEKGLAEIPPETVSGRSKHKTAPRRPPTLLTASSKAVTKSLEMRLQQTAEKQTKSVHAVLPPIERWNKGPLIPPICLSRIRLSESCSYTFPRATFRPSVRRWFSCSRPFWKPRF